MRNINISDDAGAMILLSAIKTNLKNREQVINLIYNYLSDHAIATLINLIVTDKEPVLVKKGDLIYFPNDEKYDIIDVDYDVLRDNNIYAGKDKLFGIVTDDKSYSNNFNPWYYKFDVDVIAHDSSGKTIILRKEVPFERLNIVKIKDTVKTIKEIYNASKTKGTLPF
tara:strand:+ start:83311 stop:83814 length:504 start_codon:yes stop_codon:yes gene_type:complete